MSDPLVGLHVFVADRTLDGVRVLAARSERTAAGEIRAALADFVAVSSRRDARRALRVAGEVGNDVDGRAELNVLVRRSLRDELAAVAAAHDVAVAVVVRAALARRLVDLGRAS